MKLRSTQDIKLETSGAGCQTRCCGLCVTATRKSWMRAERNVLVRGSPGGAGLSSSRHHAGPFPPDPKSRAAPDVGRTVPDSRRKMSETFFQDALTKTRWPPGPKHSALRLLPHSPRHPHSRKENEAVCGAPFAENRRPRKFSWKVYRRLWNSSFETRRHRFSRAADHLGGIL